MARQNLRRGGQAVRRPQPDCSSGSAAGGEPGAHHDLSSDDIINISRPLDRLAHATEALLTGTISPVAVTLAYVDWALHILRGPGTQLALADAAARQWLRSAEIGIALAMGRRSPTIAPAPQDSRFVSRAWQTLPFDAIQQNFLLLEEWWCKAAMQIRGLKRSSRRIVEFTNRQMLDVWSPSNFPWLNPDVLQRTANSGGRNFAIGAFNFLEDLQRAMAGEKPAGTEEFPVGERVATTPGKVVLRNDLIELIQYEPRTREVHPEPILVMSAWIMKYYILDLSPENSLIRYLVEAGHTVFAISWRNPGPELQDFGMQDYLRLGPMAALDAIGAICPDRKIHLCGYCLGGTLAAIAAAAMARDDDHRLATLTLFTAEVDFTEAGELMLFIDDSQVAYLEEVMETQGYLDGRQMAGAFQLLRSNDLIWSRMVKDYLLGERGKMIDLMAWNADTTRMPARMHSDYLRDLFLNNALSRGQYLVKGRPIALTDIRIPIFAVATEKDHVSPWRSVYKLHLLTDTALTFVLTSGGHNAGIVSEPGHQGRSFRMETREGGRRHRAAEEWLRVAPRQEGSWWPAWQRWLARRSGPMTAPPPLKGGDPAPGRYVHEA